MVGHSMDYRKGSGITRWQVARGLRRSQWLIVFSGAATPRARDAMDLGTVWLEILEPKQSAERG